MSTAILQRRTTAAAATAILFWGVTAAGVAAVHQSLDRSSPAECLAVSVFVIVAMAYAYMRVVVRDATIDQALAVGIAWTVLSIIAEVTAATRSSQPSYALLGSPDHRALRDILLVTWIAAPALFARRRA